MVKFYWAIVVASTLTMIAVVAFSKNKADTHQALKSKSVERLVKADIKKDQLQATVVR